MCLILVGGMHWGGPIVLKPCALCPNFLALLKLSLRRGAKDSSLLAMVNDLISEAVPAENL